MKKKYLFLWYNNTLLQDVHLHIYLWETYTDISDLCMFKEARRIIKLIVLQEYYIPISFEFSKIVRLISSYNVQYVIYISNIISLYFVVLFVSQISYVRYRQTKTCAIHNWLQYCLSWKCDTVTQDSAFPVIYTNHVLI